MRKSPFGKKMLAKRILACTFATFGEVVILHITNASAKQTLSHSLHFCTTLHNFALVHWRITHTRFANWTETKVVSVKAHRIRLQFRIAIAHKHAHTHSHKHAHTHKQTHPDTYIRFTLNDLISVCVCVCVFVRVRVRVCVWVCSLRVVTSSKCEPKSWKDISLSLQLFSLNPFHPDCKTAFFLFEKNFPAYFIIFRAKAWLLRKICILFYIKNNQSNT